MSLLSHVLEARAFYNCRKAMSHPILLKPQWQCSNVNKASTAFHGAVLAVEGLLRTFVLLLQGKLEQVCVDPRGWIRSGKRA